MENFNYSIQQAQSTSRTTDLPNDLFPCEFSEAKEKAKLVEDICAEINSFKKKPKEYIVVNKARSKNIRPSFILKLLNYE